MDILAILKTVQGFDKKLDLIQNQVQLLTSPQPLIPADQMQTLLSDEQRRLIAYCEEFAAADPEAAAAFSSFVEKFRAYVLSRVSKPDQTQPADEHPPTEQAAAAEPVASREPHQGKQKGRTGKPVRPYYRGRQKF